jgi:hypothetical protein
MTLTTALIAAGPLLVFPDPDQTFLRLLTLPEGDIMAITMGRNPGFERAR